MIRQLIISALLLAAGNVWEVIHTDSVERLYSATQIDFASAPETAGQFNTGWFALVLMRVILPLEIPATC